MTGPHPDPLDLSSPHMLDGKFEPEAKVVITTISDAALTSIAVSLKRIADALSDTDRAYQNAQSATFNGTLEALYQFRAATGR